MSKNLFLPARGVFDFYIEKKKIFPSFQVVDGSVATMSGNVR